MKTERFKTFEEWPELLCGGKFVALNQYEENIDNLTENIHGAVLDTAPEVLGKVRKKKKPWMTMTYDILDLCSRRRSLKKRRQEQNRKQQDGF